MPAKSPGPAPLAFAAAALLAIAAGLAAASAKASAHEWASWSARGHPKAMGLDMTVRYPVGFHKREGNRPHIVQVFSDRGGAGDYMAILLLQVNDASMGFFRTLDFGSMDEAGAVAFAKGQYLEIDPGARFLRVAKTSHEGQAAVVADVILTMERAGRRSSHLMQIMMITYKKKLITVLCGIYPKKIRIDNILNIYNKKGFNICFQFLNSFTIPDQY